MKQILIKGEFTIEDFKEDIKKIEEDIKTVVSDVKQILKVFDKEKYKTVLRQMESSNNVSAISPSGNHLGLYQISIDNLNQLRNLYKLPDWQGRDFLHNPNLQDIYIDAYIKNTSLTVNNLSNYIGKEISGTKRFTNITTKINIYGLYAGSHLASPNTLKNVLENKSDANDGRTSVNDYIAYFSKEII